jgi:hypothetical protein
MTHLIFFFTSHRLGQKWNDICIKDKLCEKLETNDFENFNMEEVSLDNNYLHFPPNRYVFKGAELNTWNDSDSSDDDM